MSSSAGVEVAPGERVDDPLEGRRHGLRRQARVSRDYSESLDQFADRGEVLGVGPIARSLPGRGGESLALGRRREELLDPRAHRGRVVRRHEPGRHPVLQIAGERGNPARHHRRAGVGRRHQPDVAGARGVVAQRDRVDGGLAEQAVVLVARDLGQHRGRARRG